MKLFLIYSCIAIPVWVAQFALYFFLRSAGRMKESLVAKCAGSFLAVGSAALAMAAFPQGPGTPWAFWFLCCAPSPTPCWKSALCPACWCSARAMCV